MIDRCFFSGGVPTTHRRGPWSCRIAVGEPRLRRSIRPGSLRSHPNSATRHQPVLAPFAQWRRQGHSWLIDTLPTFLRGAKETVAQKYCCMSLILGQMPSRVRCVFVVNCLFGSSAVMHNQPPRCLLCKRFFITGKKHAQRAETPCHCPHHQILLLRHEHFIASKQK